MYLGARALIRRVLACTSAYLDVLLCTQPATDLSFATTKQPKTNCSKNGNFRVVVLLKQFNAFY